jgi:hypothetical protein
MPWIAMIRTAGSRIPRGFFQFLDVGAGDESSTRADHHDGPNRGVAFGCLDSRQNAFGHSCAQRIHGRVVYSDHSHAITRGESYRLVHRKSVTLSYGAEATAISDDTPHSA